MEGLIFTLYAIGFILLMGMFHHVRTIWKPGISMTRRSLKQRAAVLGLAGVVFLLLAIVLHR